MQAEEAIDRVGAHHRAALRDQLQNLAARRKAGDVQRDLRGEVRVHIPRQQIAGEAEHERDEEQQHADDPLQFARRFIRAPDQHLQ